MLRIPELSTAIAAWGRASRQHPSQHPTMDAGRAPRTSLGE